MRPKKFELKVAMQHSAREDDIVDLSSAAVAVVVAASVSTAEMTMNGTSIRRTASTIRADCVDVVVAGVCHFRDCCRQ